MTTHLIVTGATGRMGQAIVRVAAVDDGVKVTSVFDPSIKAGTGPKTIAPVLAADCQIGTRLDKNVNGQVVIDFTRPDGTLQYLAEAADSGLPFVIGTTGFDSDGKKQIAAYAEKAPVVFAPNMSLGMNVMMAFAGKLAQALGDDFDADVFEAHHRNKVDAPSGSALGIGEQVMRGKGGKLGNADMSVDGPRPVGQGIRFQSVRSGGIAGDHKVTFGSDFELVELSHRALSRDVFAKGAVHAAKWVANKPAGLYSMFDVLGVSTL